MVGGSLRVLQFSTTKTGCHDIAEILLKVALNTINQPINQLIEPPGSWSIEKDLKDLQNTTQKTKDRARV
jgi:hypothetical protein